MEKQCVRNYVVSSNDKKNKIMIFCIKFQALNYEFTISMDAYLDVDWHTLQSMLIAFLTTHGSIFKYMQKVNMQDFDFTHSIWNYTCIKEH
jgi:hypothetical protein